MTNGEWLESNGIPSDYHDLKFMMNTVTNNPGNLEFAKGENSMKLHRGDIIDIFKPETIAEQVLVDQGKDDGIHRYLLWNINNDAVSHYAKNGADMLIKADTIVGIGLTPYGEEIDLTIDDILKGHPKVVKHISIEAALHNIFMSNKYDIDDDGNFLGDPLCFSVSLRR